MYERHSPRGAMPAGIKRTRRWDCRPRQVSRRGGGALGPAEVTGGASADGRGARDGPRLARGRVEQGGRRGPARASREARVRRWVRTRPGLVPVAGKPNDDSRRARCTASSSRQGSRHEAARDCRTDGDRHFSLLARRARLHRHRRDAERGGGEHARGNRISPRWLAGVLPSHQRWQRRWHGPPSPARSPCSAISWSESAPTVNLARPLTPVGADWADLGNHGVSLCSTAILL